MDDALVTVSCAPVNDGWRCHVTVGDDRGATDHEVLVDRDTYERLAGGASPDALVHASFDFLLEREPRTSIMRSFELPVIGRFFPEYEAEIRRRMAGDERQGRRPDAS